MGGIPKAEEGLIEIKKGDTLSEIAKALGVTVDKLLELNPQITNRDRIYAGTTLKVPDTSKSSNKLTVSSDTEDYTIQRGDTLSSIAQKHGVSLNLLLVDNPLYVDNPNFIKAGDIIKIQKSDSNTSSNSNASNSNASDSNTSSNSNTSKSDTSSNSDSINCSYHIDNKSLDASINAWYYKYYYSWPRLEDSDPPDIEYYEYRCSLLRELLYDQLENLCNKEDVKSLIKNGKKVYLFIDDNLDLKYSTIQHPYLSYFYLGYICEK